MRVTTMKMICSFIKANLFLVAFYGFFGNQASNAQNLAPVEFVFYDSVASEGYYFLLPITVTPPFTYSHAQMIYDKSGNMVYYCTFFEGGLPTTTADFKLHSNGLMSFFSPVLNRFYLMDSTFIVIDSVEAIGFKTDTHELQILDNGHYLLLGKETRIMNLSQYFWFGPNNNLPGSKNAEVTGAVIQELDENKNLIWEWKAHDYFSFADVYQAWLSSPSIVDWTHSNALEKDFDGNILLSSRHLHEITKINYQDSSIIWRMGGKNNDFNFLNDSIGWSGQHDIRRHADGTVSLWNNGQHTNPALGRAMVLDLNEHPVNPEATVVWEYLQDSAMYSYAMGNHQISPGGNHLINFGFVNPIFPITVVVKPNKEKILEIFAPESYANYRAFNYPVLPWKLNRPHISCEEIDESYFLVAESGHSQYLWSTGETTQTISVSATGVYNVFVPYGGGMISSKYISIPHLNNVCMYLGPENETLNLTNIEISSLIDTCFHALQTITTAGNGTTFQVNPGGNVQLIAGQNIIFKEGTHIEQQSYLHAWVAINEEYCFQQKNIITQNFESEFINGEPENAEVNQLPFRIYPNPTSGVFTLTFNDYTNLCAAHVYIFNNLGTLVLEARLKSNQDNIFNLTNYPAGVYIVKVTTENTVGFEKLIKQ